MLYSNLVRSFSDTYGWIPEWPKGTDCKSAANCFGGSNPPPPIKFCSLNFVFSGRGLYAGVAELADAQDLKSCRSNTVPVRFRSPALIKKRNIDFQCFSFFVYFFTTVVDSLSIKSGRNSVLLIHT